MQTRGNSAANHLPVDSNVKRLSSLCDMHRAPHGAPGALAGFMDALDADKHLAMDFWALVARMTDEESGKLSTPALNGRILEVIVTVVTGQSVAEMIARGGDDKRYVGDLASMLAGEDIHRPVVERNIAVMTSSTSDVEAASGRAAFESQFGRGHSSSSNRPGMSAPGVATKPVTAALRSDGPVIKPSAVTAEAVRGGVDGQTLFAEAQALTAEAEGSSRKEAPGAHAVESSAAESIPKTQTTIATGKPVGSIRRLEQRLAVQPISPRVNDVASDSSSADVSAAITDLSLAALPRDPAGRLRETRPSPRIGQGVLFPEDKQAERISLEDYGERESRSVLLPMLLVLVLAVGGWGAYLAQRAGMINIFGKSPDTKHADTAGNDPGTEQGSEQGRAARNDEAPAQQERPERSEDGESAAAPAETSKEAKPEAVPSSSLNAPVKGEPAIDPGLYASTVIPKKIRKATEEVAPIAAGSGMAGGGVPSGVTEPGTGRPLVVWKAVPQEAAPVVRVTPPSDQKRMSGSLIEGAKISGPDPDYPRLAKANQISGTVILHATITKTGSVTNLTVVSGPVDLRKSAKAAVSKWKYRPYLLDGQPTEAERTIRVDFKPAS